MDDYSKGAAYLSGDYMPLDRARIPVTHFAFRRSDVCYDVVGVWDGAFFRLDDHIRRFRASMAKLRMTPPESDDDIRRILHRIVALSGLRRAYVAMDCLRASPPPGAPRSAAFAPSYLSCFAVPWISLADDGQMARGLHVVIPDVQRIAPEAVDPRVKNFHWGDLTAGLFQAHDAGADTAVLADARGMITEGPGFNVFSITGGTVATPRCGALEGITRQSVMELCAELGLPLELRDLSVAEFRQADEAFVCSTAGGIMPVSRIDGRIMGNDRPGPVSTRLRDRFWQKRAEGWHATPVDYSLA